MRDGERGFGRKKGQEKILSQGVWAWGSTPDQSPLSPFEGTAILRWLQWVQVNRFDCSLSNSTSSHLWDAGGWVCPGASAPHRRQGHLSGAALKAASGPLYPSSVVDVLEILRELINSMLSVIPMLEGTKNPEELHPQV